MATDVTETKVRVRFSALAAHVRTARLVAAAVARRTGVDEAVLDEVRLAVGEACSRAVDLHRRHCPGDPVLLTLTDRVTSFVVEVQDKVPGQEAADDALSALTDTVDLDDASLSAGVGLAVIDGLVDDLVVEQGSDGTVVRMSWPLLSALS